MTKPTTSADQLEQRLRTAFRFSLISNIALAVMILMVGGGFLYARFVMESSSLIDENKLAQEARQRLVNNADTIVAEGTDLAVETLPPMSEAFLNQVEEDVPIYLQVTKQQSKQLVEDLKVSLREKAKQEFRDFLQKHRQVLAEEVPEAASKEAIAKLEQEFVKAYDRMIQRYHIDEFEKQVQRTETQWAKIEPLDNPPAEKELYEQLFQMSSDYVLLQLKDILEENSEAQVTASN